MSNTGLAWGTDEGAIRDAFSAFGEVTEGKYCDISRLQSDCSFRCFLRFWSYGIQYCCISIFFFLLSYPRWVIANFVLLAVTFCLPTVVVVVHAMEA